MPKKDAKKTPIRLVKRGDIVKTQTGGEEVIRNVQVVLQLSNGSNESYDASEEIEVLPPEELPEL